MPRLEGTGSARTRPSVKSACDGWLGVQIHLHCHDTCTSGGSLQARPSPLHDSSRLTTRGVRISSRAATFRDSLPMATTFQILTLFTHGTTTCDSWSTADRHNPSLPTPLLVTSDALLTLTMHHHLMTQSDS